MKQQHNLDGIYFRIERDGKWMNVCLSDMREEELDGVLEHRDAEWYKTVIHHLCCCLYEIGEQEGLYGKWRYTDD